MKILPVMFFYLKNKIKNIDGQKYLSEKRGAVRKREGGKK